MCEQVSSKSQKVDMLQQLVNEAHLSIEANNTDLNEVVCTASQSLFSSDQHQSANSVEKSYKKIQ